MNQTQSDSLQSFHHFVGQQLSTGAATISPEQALAMWRAREADIAAIREGLADVAAGRARPADEVLQELRAKLS